MARDRNEVPTLIDREQRAFGTIRNERGQRETVVMTRDGAYVADHGSPGLRKRKATAAEIERAKDWKVNLE